mmetsp:Transcript_5049/g.20758  ORF Transcript_5049/g.20758 Transcript_5049/m.20758 type:complete len:340 (-) Transcript_5049:104-1123(-)
MANDGVSSTRVTSLRTRDPAPGSLVTMVTPVRRSMSVFCSAMTARVSAICAVAAASLAAVRPSPAMIFSSASALASSASPGSRDAFMAAASRSRDLSAAPTILAWASRASSAALASSVESFSSSGSGAIFALASPALSSAASASLSSASSASTRLARRACSAANSSAAPPTARTSSSTLRSSASLASFSSFSSAFRALNSSVSVGGVDGTGLDSRMDRRKARSVPSSMVPNFSLLMFVLMRSRSVSPLPSAFSAAPSRIFLKESWVWLSSASARLKVGTSGLAFSARMASPLRKRPGEWTEMSSKESSFAISRVCTFMVASAAIAASSQNSRRDPSDFA